MSDYKSNLGTGLFNDTDRAYWKAAVKLYLENEVKKSDKIIQVDFKNKRIIKGATRIVKNAVNKKAA